MENYFSFLKYNFYCQRTFEKCESQSVPSGDDTIYQLPLRDADSLCMASFRSSEKIILTNKTSSHFSCNSFILLKPELDK